MITEVDGIKIKKIALELLGFACSVFGIFSNLPEKIPNIWLRLIVQSIIFGIICITLIASLSELFKFNILFTSKKFLFYSIILIAISCLSFFVLKNNVIPIMPEDSETWIAIDKTQLEPITVKNRYNNQNISKNSKLDKLDLTYNIDSSLEILNISNIGFSEITTLSYQGNLASMFDLSKYIKFEEKIFTKKIYEGECEDFSKYQNGEYFKISNLPFKIKIDEITGSTSGRTYTKFTIIYNNEELTTKIFGWDAELLNIDGDYYLLQVASAFHRKDLNLNANDKNKILANIKNGMFEDDEVTKINEYLAKIENSVDFKETKLSDLGIKNYSKFSILRIKPF